MSSQLKIEANRRNAILPEEDRAEFHALLAGLVEEFQPATAREESHVRELASAEWRQRRIVRRASLRREHPPARPRLPPPLQRRGLHQAHALRELPPPHQTKLTNQTQIPPPDPPLEDTYAQETTEPPGPWPLDPPHRLNACATEDRAQAFSLCTVSEPRPQGSGPRGRAATPGDPR